MKYLKYLGILVLLLILGYLAACYFGPKDISVEETTKIDAPSSIVFNLINDVKKWEEWNDWNLQDTGMVITYSDDKEGVGARSEWTESMHGNGSQEIVESVSNDKIRIKMNFEGWDGDNFSNWKFIPNGNATDVSWGFEGTELPFLMRGRMLTAKSGMRKSFRKGFDNISRIAKARVEDNYNGYTIQKTVLTEKNFVMSRQEIAIPAIQQFYATNLGSLFGKVQAGGVEMDGMPCGLFFRLDERDGKIDMAAAIPTKEAISVQDAQSYHIEAKNALQIDYYGDYHGTTKAHKAMGEFMRDRGYFQDTPVIEEYVTDPGTEEDPSKWLTRITYYYSE